MAGLNKCMIIGNLGKDPELRYLPSGKAVANFSVAVNEVYYKNEEKVESTEWFNISAFGRSAEIAEQMLEKGSQVFIEGRIQNRQWDDSDGNTRYSWNVVVRHMVILRGKPRERDPEDPSGQGHEEDLRHDIQDDIPF